MPKPRPIEFMRNGYTLSQMHAILAKWETFSVEELGRMGFGKISPTAQPTELVSIAQYRARKARER